MEIFTAQGAPRVNNTGGKCKKSSTIVTNVKNLQSEKLKVWWQDATLFVYFSYFL